MGDSQAVLTRRSTGRLWLWLGLCLPVLAVAAFAVQIANEHLKTPWYLPVLATLGVVLVAFALWQRRTVWRWIALAVVVLFAGAIGALFVMMRLPAYQGPVAAGKPFPTFTTARADGTPFTEHDLQGSENHLLVFFRGRW